MNWQQFKDYLENNVIETNDEGWSLKAEAIDKYLDETPTISRKNNLEKAIVNLILSLRATLNDLDGFHRLPTYDSNKTWSQLIPSDIALGEIKGKEELLDTNTYNLLDNIFKDWFLSKVFDDRKEYEWEEKSTYEFSPSQESAKEKEEMVHDQLNWDEFKYWLNHNILDTNDEISSEAATKYRINNPNKFLAALDNLIATIENTQNANYYQLPHFCLANTNWKGEEEPRVKTWLELFPIREKTLFGKRTQREIIDAESFNVLGAMHSDFIRFNKLTDELNEESFLTKFLMEAIVHLNFDLIKSKGYDKFLTNWLSEYEKLTEQEQESLHVQKSMAEKFTGIIADESNTQSSFWTKIKQHGTTIAWIGGGILLIIFVWGWIKSKTK